MSYTMKREDVYGFAAVMGADTHEKGNELFFRVCPKCKGGHDGDRDTFSINLETGAFKCFRASCDYHGHFVELARDFDYKLESEPIKVFKPMPQPKRVILPNQKAIDYMASRGIGREVVERYEITTRKDNDSILAFPFFDDQGVLQFAKYRNMAYKKGDKGSKEWCEKDTMPILFGMKQCEDFTRLVITEGQLDSLSLAEAGIKNAVSVPTGALGFTWLAHCWDWVSKFEEVVIFGDCENGKITLVDTLKARLTNPIKVVRVQDYLGEKDANAILTKFGPEALVIAVRNAEPPKIENVKDLSTVRSVNINDLDKIPTGISEVDRTIGGLIMGQVVLLTGKAGEGKSTFMSQLVCSALDNGESIFAYSGELADFHFKRWIDFQLAGAESIEESENMYGDKVYSIPEATVKQIGDWYKGRAFIYDNDYIPEGKQELESLLDTVEKVIKQYGCRLICIDNLMTAMDAAGDKDKLYLAQGAFVGRLKKLAQKYQVVFILVAHPRKSKDGFSNDDVSGSSDITNKVDVVLAYQRAPRETNASSILQITKNRLFGRLKTGDDGIRLMYSEKTKRIFSVNDRTPKRYGWKDKVFYDVTEQEEIPF